MRYLNVERARGVVKGDWNEIQSHLKISKKIFKKTFKKVRVYLAKYIQI